MKIITLWRAALIGVLLLLFAPIGAASAATGAPPLAKGGVVIYDWGETIYPQGPLPDELAALPEFAGFEAGYLCDAKGLFWSDVMVSDCRPVAFQDNVYDDQDVVKDAIAAKYPEMHRSLWNRFGWILMILGVLLLGGAKLVFGKRT
jgi:hypothetical protein